MTYLSLNHCFRDSKHGHILHMDIFMPPFIPKLRGHLPFVHASSCSLFLFKGIYRVSIKYNEENTCFEKFSLIFRRLLIFFKDVFPLS